MPGRFVAVDDGVGPPERGGEETGGFAFVGAGGGGGPGAAPFEEEGIGGGVGLEGGVVAHGFGGAGVHGEVAVARRVAENRGRADPGGFELELAVGVAAGPEIAEMEMRPGEARDPGVVAAEEGHERNRIGDEFGGVFDVARLARKTAVDAAAEPDALGETAESGDDVFVAGKHEGGPPAQGFDIVVGFAAEFAVGDLAFVDPVVGDMAEAGEGLELRGGPGGGGGIGGEGAGRAGVADFFAGVHGDERIGGFAAAEDGDVAIEGFAVFGEMLFDPDPIEEARAKPEGAGAEREGVAGRMFDERIEQAQRDLVAREHAAAGFETEPFPAGFAVPAFGFLQEGDVGLPVGAEGAELGGRRVLAELEVERVEGVAGSVAADFGELAGEPTGEIGGRIRFRQEVDGEQAGAVGGGGIRMREGEGRRLAGGGGEGEDGDAVAADGRRAGFFLEAELARVVREVKAVDGEADGVGVAVAVVEKHEGGPAAGGEIEAEGKGGAGDAVVEGGGADAGPSRITGERGGGRWSWIVLRRKSRSWRNLPAATSVARSALVAEMRRTLAR